MKQCDKERCVSRKYREARQPTRLFIHTCERHPALPGVQHPDGVVEKQALSASTVFFPPFFPSVGVLLSYTILPIRDLLLH